MPAYLENGTFGLGAFSCTALVTSKPIFAGQASGATATAANALAIDLSKWVGNYKNRYTVRLQVVEDFVTTGGSYLDFTLHFISTANGAQTLSKNPITARIALSKLAKSKITPMEFTLPSIADDSERYVRLELGTDATAVTAGAILVTIEPSEM